MNDQPIKNVTEYKYLGLTLDPALDFTKHINKTTKTLKYSLATFRSIRYSLSIEAAKSFFHAMIMSHLSYCITSWSQANKTNLKPLESIYKNALKILDKKTKQYHHCFILNKYGLLNFENLVSLYQIQLVYKIVHNLAPPPLKAFVHLVADTTKRVTRSRTRGECTIPSYKTAFARSSFSYAGVQKWNKLPSEILALNDYKAFTKEVKAWLLQNQRCCH